MPRSPRLSAAKPVTLWSPRKMSPLVGFRSPERRLTRVVFPAPFGPMTAWISPIAKSSDTSLTAARPPKRFESATVRSAISAMIALPLWHHARHQPLQPARERQHDRDDDQALDQLPVFGQPLQRLLQPHHDD